jgi:hypothetical protein
MGERRLANNIPEIETTTRNSAFFAFIHFHAFGGVLRDGLVNSGPVDVVLEHTSKGNPGCDCH